MTPVVTAVAETPTDAALLSAVRGGDTGAYARLYLRHRDPARRLAGALARDPHDADDLVAEAFAKVFAALRKGAGPQLAFRPYLLTAVRHACYDRVRARQRLELTEDMQRYEQPSDPDSSDDWLARTYAARAFAKLPERWRMVLWHTEVEGERPARVAPLLGLTPNAVAALAYRARERLRQMYLQEHLHGHPRPACRATANRLGAYVRRALSRRGQARVEAHLADCRDCHTLRRRLSEINSGLRHTLGVLVLGAAASAYLTVAGPGVVSRTLSPLPARIVHRATAVLHRCAGVGAVAATAAGVTLIALGLTFGQATPGPARPHSGAGPPVPAPAPAPAPAARTTASAVAPAPAPQGIVDTRRPLPPTPAATAPPPAAGGGTLPARTAPSTTQQPAPTTAATPEPTTAAADPTHVLTLTVPAPAPDTATDTPVVVRLDWPEQVRLASSRAEAGDGWRCTADEAGATCQRPAWSGPASTCAVPVAVHDADTGLVPITVSGADRQRYHLAVAAPQATVSYAAHGRYALAQAGNGWQGDAAASPPAGLGEAMATSASAVTVDPARVVWAGLHWRTGDGQPPPPVWLAGPGGPWHRVTSDQRRYGYADVTALVRAADRVGDWWVAAPSDRLVRPPAEGPQAPAGWRLTVVYADAHAPERDLAVFTGVGKDAAEFGVLAVAAATSR